MQDEDIPGLVRRFYVRSGILTGPAIPKGWRAFNCCEVHRVKRMISLIGAPCDAGANQPGACLGPAALRAAGLQALLQGRGRLVQDCGDLTAATRFGSAAAGGCRHLPEVLAWNTAVYEAVHSELERGHLPVLLGGDHSLAIGSISAVARHCRDTGRALRILWLDAHADCNTPLTSPSGNLHGMPVACLCGFGPIELSCLGGRTPVIQPVSLRYLGVRSVDTGEKSLLQELGMTLYDMAHIRRVGMRATVAQALAGLDDRTHLHVSLDVDFLGPEIAPGVSVPVAGGLTREEAQLCMELIAQSGLLASLDLMELNPRLDTGRATAEVSVRLVASLLADRATLPLHPAWT
jgi:arginase